MGLEITRPGMLEGDCPVYQRGTRVWVQCCCYDDSANFRADGLLNFSTNSEDLSPLPGLFPLLEDCSSCAGTQWLQGWVVKHETIHVLPTFYTRVYTVSFSSDDSLTKSGNIYLPCLGQIYQAPDERPTSSPLKRWSTIEAYIPARLPDPLCPETVEWCRCVATIMTPQHHLNTRLHVVYDLDLSEGEEENLSCDDPDGREVVPMEWVYNLEDIIRLLYASSQRGIN